jgi:hypothetical protein
MMRLTLGLLLAAGLGLVPGISAKACRVEDGSFDFVCNSGSEWWCSTY